MDKPSVLDAKASVIRNARSLGPAGHSKALGRLCLDTDTQERQSARGGSCTRPAR